MVKKSRKVRILIKTVDKVMDGGRPTDIVIPVMGPIGVGKSTFINHLLGKNAMLVGHDISSCTSTLQYAIVDNPSLRKGHRVVIVDTPGFDNTSVDDQEILRRIAVWLTSSYDDKMTLGGVIYLQSIADKRMNSMTPSHLDKFNQFCGDKAPARVVLGTTNWGEVDEKVGEKREQQIAKTFWNNMTASGSESLRFDKTEKSARAFLDAVLTDPVMILLMGEVGAGKSTFINTAAGKTLTKVGEDGDLNPCTSTVNHFVVEHHKRKVVLVDTPGFNHPTKADGDVLKGIVDWLKIECPQNIQFSGIIYLYDLCQSNGPSRKEQMMSPTKLTDPEPRRLVLATVDGDSDAAKLRESQLKSSIRQEVQTYQFMNTQDSAWSILDPILGFDPIKLQDIQDELDRVCTRLCSTQPAQKSNRNFLKLFFNLLDFIFGRRSKITKAIIPVSSPRPHPRIPSNLK